MRQEDGGKRWPESVYDYDRGVIVDSEVGALDLACGMWVRCECCAKDLRMKNSFGLSAWKLHKKRMGHCQARDQGRVTSVEESPASSVKSTTNPSNQQRQARKRQCEEPSASNDKSPVKRRKDRKQATERLGEEPTEYADFAAAMAESIETDTDYLVSYQKELEKRAKEEVQTKELIRKMAFLVADQQEDMDALRDDVDDLKELVHELQDTVEDMRRANRDLHQKRRRRYDADDSPLKRHELVSGDDRDERVEEIDMFGDEIQLTQLD